MESAICNEPMMQSVRFSSEVLCRTVPDRDFYVQNCISDDIWYSKSDLRFFRKSAMLEISAYVFLFGVDFKFAKKSLYQNSVPIVSKEKSIKYVNEYLARCPDESDSAIVHHDYNFRNDGGLSVEFMTTSYEDDNDDISQYL